MILIELINNGSVPYCGSNDNNSTGVSLSEILFSFIWEKYIVCDTCGLRSPSFESSSVLYITPTCTSSMQELIKQGMEQNLAKSCFWCKRNTWHIESDYILQPPNISLLLSIDLNILRTILPKTDVPYLWIWLLYLVSIYSACRLPKIITDQLCILAIILPLSTVVHWSAAPHHRIAYRTGSWMCVVLVLNVIRCSCHYFLDKILFHHDFHHDTCDYHFDFYGH